MNLITLLILDNRHLCLLQRERHRILRPEDICQLLQGPVLRLHKQEINNRNLKAVPEDKQEVILPPRAGKSNSSHKRVVQAGDVDPEVVHPIPVARLS